MHPGVQRDSRASAGERESQPDHSRRVREHLTLGTLGTLVIALRKGMYLLLLAKKVASPKSAQTSTPSPHPGFLAPRGAPWMAGDGFTRRELAGGRTAAN